MDWIPTQGGSPVTGSVVYVDRELMAMSYPHGQWGGINRIYPTPWGPIYPSDLRT